MNPEASSSSMGLREDMIGDDEMGQARKKRRSESDEGVSSAGLWKEYPSDSSAQPVPYVTGFEQKTIYESSVTIGRSSLR